eukprot:5090616-Amphidinium_carterae.1
MRTGSMQIGWFLHMKPRRVGFFALPDVHLPHTASSMFKSVTVQPLYGSDAMQWSLCPSEEHWSSAMNGQHVLRGRSLTSCTRLLEETLGSQMRPAWRGFVISDLRPDAVPHNGGILQQALLSVDWCFPCVASWNARALFHSRHSLAKCKAQFFTKLAKQADITCVQEAHVATEDDIELLHTPDHQCFWSGNSAATGGLLVAVKKRYLEDVATTWTELVVGRIAVLRLERHNMVRQIVVVHLSPDPRHTWDELVHLLGDYIDKASCVTIVAGDCNVVLEQADRIEIGTGAPSTDLGPRQRVWKRCIHANEVHAGLSHYNVARQWLSCLDRFLINLSEAVLEVLGARGEVVGTAGHPPAGSDHWAIMLRFQVDSAIDAHPRWTFQHAGYAISANHWAHVLKLDELDWHEGLATLQSLVDTAVVDVRSDSNKLGDDPFIQR